MKSTDRQTILILHNIRSAHNVGSLLRTADAAGISKIFLTGYTPSPIDKFGKVNKEIAKTALGAEKTLFLEHKARIIPLLNQLKSDKYFLVAIEQNKKSKSYRNIKIKNKTVFILGNEVTGLEKKVLEKVDAIAEIPMKGKKESLNVSAAGAVALFQMLEI